MYTTLICIFQGQTFIFIWFLIELKLPYFPKQHFLIHTNGNLRQQFIVAMVWEIRYGLSLFPQRGALINDKWDDTVIHCSDIWDVVKVQSKSVLQRLTMCILEVITLSCCTRTGKWADMYLCIMAIDFAFFYDLVFEYGIVPMVWYYVVVCFPFCCYSFELQ